MLKVLNDRRYLYLILAGAVIAVALLAPVVGSTENGGDTFLLSITALAYKLTGTTVSDDSGSPYPQAANLGLVICGLIGLVGFVCIFQLVRLWVRKRLR